MEGIVSVRCENSTESAQEFLKEGEVEEFKVGDRVEVVERMDGMDYTGRTGVIKDDCSWSTEVGLFTVEFDGGHRWNFYPKCLKLTSIQNKPKSKENIMSGINSTLRTVLIEENDAKYALVEKIQQTFGAEIAQNFTGLINFRRDKQLYIDEIKRLEDEAKKAAKEAAKNK